MKETFNYQNFTKYITVNSKILPRHTISKTFFICPICQTTHDDIKHGESIDCCDIKFTRFGNALTCEKQ